MPDSRTLNATTPTRHTDDPMLPAPVTFHQSTQQAPSERVGNPQDFEWVPCG